MAMKSAAAVLASALLLAGPGRAQPAAPDPAAAPAVTAAPAPAPGKVVEGVTVTGRRLPPKTCSSRDDGCVATVVAELKARYPQELQKWCMHVEERAAMNSIEFMEINLDRPHPNVMPYLPPAVTKVACAPDKKH